MIFTKTKEKVITSEDIQNDMIFELNLIFGRDFSAAKQKVNNLKSENEVVIKKASLLNKLGFGNTPTAKNVEQLEKDLNKKQQEIELEQKDIELTNKYRIEYPGYKFIPTKVFDDVCERYNLYTSTPERYIKEVPDKNLQEIENFIGKYGTVWQRIGTFVMEGGKTIEKESKHREEVENVESMKGYLFGSYYYTNIVETAKIDITAPIDHFNLDKSEISGRVIRDIKVEDPIVSRPVEGGRIIISVWDKEADIPEIKNNEWN